VIEIKPNRIFNCQICETKITIKGVKMKKIIFLITVVFITTFSFQVSAQNNKGKMIKAKKAINELNLADQQEEKFNQIRFEHQEKKIDIQAKLKKNKLEIKKLMSLNDLDEQKLLNFVDKGSKLRDELIKSRTNMWLSIYNILDDDQKEIWKDKFQQFGRKGGLFKKCNFGQGNSAGRSSQNGIHQRLRNKNF